MKNILVLYHSRLGSVQKMAELISRGVAQTDDCQAWLRTVPNVTTGLTTTDAVPEAGAPYATLDELAECDGLILGSPTRFGNMSAEMKHFLDSSSSIWS